MFLHRTRNLDKSFYEQLTRRILYEFLTAAEIIEFLKVWEIEFHNLEYMNRQFFAHVKLQEGQRISSNSPAGVTGQGQIILYLHDSKNEMKTRENTDRLQHELCHAVLFFLYKNLRLEGQKQNMATKAVHDQNNGGQRFKINFWHRKFLFWKKMQISIIDIRHLTKARNKQN